MIQKLERLVAKIGSSISWMILLLALVVFLTVFLRYVVGFSRIWIQDLAIYLHGLVFMGVAGWSLAKGRHVRVDVFYDRMSPEKKKLIDRIGTIIFLWPAVGVIFYHSWPYVMDSWELLEGAKDTGGLPITYIQKSFILLFCIVLFLQSLTIFRRSE